MSQARGTQIVIGLYDETTYGQDPGAPDAKRVYATGFNVRASRESIVDDTLLDNRGVIAPDPGNWDVAGQLPVVIAPENVGPLLRHALGQVATSGVGPYTHVITCGALPTSFMLERDHGPNIAGSGRFEKFNGCRIADVEFSFPQTGRALANFNVRGAAHTLAAAALDATYTDAGHNPFAVNSFQASIEEGGSAIATVTAASIRLNNDLDDSAYVIGSNNRGALVEGKAIVSGQITALFDSPTLLTKAINDTQSSLKIKLSKGDGLGTAGNESIEFLVQQLKYRATSPETAGPRGVLITLDFDGFISGADLGLQVTLKNALATI